MNSDPRPSGERETLSARLKRYAQFQKFHDNAQVTFKQLAARDMRCRRLERIHAFYVATGGASGGTDKRVVEVFFGNRPYDQVRPEMPPFETSSPTYLVERGARLRYDRLDNGYVLCQLYPARTDRFGPIEQSIFMRFMLDPRRLTPDDTLLESHFNTLVSYMECTSLDGEPSWGDRIRVGNLRRWKKRVIGDQVQPRWLLQGLGRIIEFALVVGLSGFVLEIVRVFFGPVK